MPRKLKIADEGVASLEECVDSLSSRGFDPQDEESLLHAAGLLSRLGNDRDFIGDLLIEELASWKCGDDGKNFYGPQVIMLVPPSGRDFFMRANIWPSEGEHMMRASGSSTFVYGFPHDHNFDFLTLGYFGPGYWSDYYEYDFEKVVGWSGEPVDLRFTERSALEQGKILHYRGHLDVHAQLPADSLSVSVNIMHTGGAQGWHDQYSFDVENCRIGRILSNGSSETFMRLAVGLGSGEAIDLAHRFGKCHPSDRMRLSAWNALASVAADAQARDKIWRDAEMSGSRLVAAEARLRRGELAV